MFPLLESIGWNKNPTKQHSLVAYKEGVQKSNNEHWTKYVTLDVQNGGNYYLAPIKHLTS